MTHVIGKRGDLVDCLEEQDVPVEHKEPRRSEPLFLPHQVTLSVEGNEVFVDHKC